MPFLKSPQEVIAGVSVALGVASLGAWGLLTLGWHLGPHGATVHLAAAPPAPVATATPMAAPRPVSDPADRPLEAEGDPRPGIQWDPPLAEVPARGDGAQGLEAADPTPARALPHVKSLLLPTGKQPDPVSLSGKPEAQPMEWTAGGQPVKGAAAPGKPVQAAKGEPEQPAQAGPATAGVAKPAAVAPGKPMQAVASKPGVAPARVAAPAVVAVAPAKPALMAGQGAVAPVKPAGVAAQPAVAPVKPEAMVAKPLVGGAPTAAKPVAAAAAAGHFPTAAPVVHPRYVLAGRLRRHWVLAARAAGLPDGMAPADAPARDRNAAEPRGSSGRLPTRLQLLARKAAQAQIAAAGEAALAALNRPVQVAGQPMAKPLPGHGLVEAPEGATQGMSPGAMAELAESRRAERESGVPAGLAAKPVARAALPHESAVALTAHPVMKPAGRPAVQAAARPVQHPAIQQAAHPVLHPAIQQAARPVAQQAARPATHAPGHVYAANGVFAAQQPAPRATATQGVMFHTVTVGGGSSHAHVTAGGPATLGAPVYDASSHTLRVPLAGHVPGGALHVHRLDNGRAYVDVAGVQPGSERTRALDSPDGTFRRGAIAGHPQTGGTRLSFEVPANAKVNATIEDGALVLHAVTKP